MTRNRNNLWLFYALAFALWALGCVGCCIGCDARRHAELKGELYELQSQCAGLDIKLNHQTEKLAEASAKLDKLLARRILPIGASQQASPDIRAAVGHSLKAASALVGEERVVGVFRDISGNAIDNQLTLPRPVKEPIKKKVQAEVAEAIQKLLDE